MSTAVVQAPPTITTPGPTAQVLAKLAAFSGIGLVIVSVLLALFHPAPDLQKELLTAGLGLAGSSAGIYGVLTTALKYVAVAKHYETQANFVAGMIPGTAGSDVQKVLGIVEKLIDNMPDPTAAAPAPAPTAVAAAAGADAAAKPASTL